MRIETDFDVGQVRYVARCFKVSMTETMVDVHGVQWERDVPKFVPKARKRTIERISISVGAGGYSVSYYCEESGIKMYRAEDLKFGSEEEAMSVAREYAAREEEYYGPEIAPKP